MSPFISYGFVPARGDASIPTTRPHLSRPYAVYRARRTSVSDSRHASIRGPGRAGHIRGLVRGKEKHHRSNLFRLPGAPQGNGTQQTIKLLVVLHEIFRHGCIHEARDNSVDP